ncbi:MAG: hypothetical protein ACREIU_03940, partial [Planctomycetota bacterium]
ILLAVLPRAKETILRLAGECSSSTSRQAYAAADDGVYYACCTVDGRKCLCECVRRGEVEICTPLAGCPPCPDYFELAVGTGTQHPATDESGETAQFSIAPRMVKAESEGARRAPTGTPG